MRDAGLAALLAVLLAGAGRAAPPPAADDDIDAAAFTSVDVEVGGRLLDLRFVDMDGDGRRDLVLAAEVAREDEESRREIHIHLAAADGSVPVAPSQVIPVLDDAIVYGCADVRDEPGRELVFLTRSGAWSYSPQLPGYRNNIRHLASMDLLFQVPSAHALPSWSYIIPHEPHDLILLPGGGGMTLWAPRAVAPDAAAPDAAAPGDDYELQSRFGGNEKGTLFSGKSPGALTVGAGGLSATIESRADRGLFLEEAPTSLAAMLEADAHYRAPALLDVDGDRRTDLLLFKENLLHVYLGTDQGLPDAPTRTEALPPYLEKGDGELILSPRDLNGDGRMDILARLSPEHRSIGSIVFSYFVLINDGTRLLPEQPQQVLRFEGSGTESAVTDVNADGRPDLVITKWQLPSLQDVVSGFKLERSAFVYFAEERGDEPFARKPALRDEQSFNLESLPDALVRRFLSGDLSGDGLADLVEVDLTGRVAIRRVEHETSFFGRGSYAFEEAPWKRFDLGADLSRLQLEDVNGDGVADIINPGRNTLALMLSRRGAGEAER